MLDTRTLFTVVTALCFFVAMLVAAVWRGGRRYGGMREVSSGLGLLAAGFVVQGLRGLSWSPEGLALVLIAGNLLVVVGSLLIVNGAVMLAGARPSWRRDTALTVIAFAVFLYYLLVDVSMQMRVAAFGSWSALLCLGALLALLARREDDGSRATRNLFAGCMMLHGGAETVRALGAGYLYPVNDFLAPNPVLTFFLLEYMFAILALAVLSLQFVSERLQRDLRRSEGRVAAAIEVSSDAFAVFGGDGCLVVANPRFGDMFATQAPAMLPGAPVDAVLAQGAEPFGIEPGWLLRGCDGFVLGAAADRAVRLADGRWMHVSASTTEGGGLVLCWHDITDYKQAEAVLAGELVRERELSAMQRSFVSMASHQFRTPLSIIDLDAQVISQKSRGGAALPDLPERAGRIRRTVQRMIALIDMMLGAASAEAGRIEARFSPCNLGAIVRDVCERSREVARAAGVEIDVDIDGLPPVVRCDPNLIEQVIGNLLSNAIKYSGGKGPVIVCGAAEQDRAMIRVTDCGVGIAPDEQPLIFERFFRARNAAGIAGTGIGLSVASHIVGLHDGAISVESRLGIGSTFTVRLPVG